MSSVPRQYIGEHIRCITGGSIPEHVINTFCFFTTTFTVVTHSQFHFVDVKTTLYSTDFNLSSQVRHFNETLLEKGIIPHPGIGELNEKEELRYHAYYQWVPFVLFAQAMMFYLPHLVWRRWEGMLHEIYQSFAKLQLFKKSTKIMHEFRGKKIYWIVSRMASLNMVTNGHHVLLHFTIKNSAPSEAASATSDEE